MKKEPLQVEIIYSYNDQAQLEFNDFLEKKSKDINIKDIQTFDVNGCRTKIVIYYNNIEEE